MNDFDYRGKRVLVTGHTGFKGSWIAIWLHHLGAQVYGYSLEPPTAPSNYELAGVRELLADEVIGDIRDRAKVAAAVQKWQPDIVFHLAAQPLVRLSYECPYDTFEANVLGTASVLDAVRLCNLSSPAIKQSNNQTIKQSNNSPKPPSSRSRRTSAMRTRSKKPAIARPTPSAATTPTRPPKARRKS